MPPTAILVIDDDPTVHELMKEHLKKEGFKVILAESEKSAYGWPREKKPHAITLDILMRNGRLDRLEKKGPRY